MIKPHQAKFESDYGLPPVDVPAEIGYVYAYPFPFNDKHPQELMKLEPSILTYRQDDLTMEELMQKLKQSVPSIDNDPNLRFTLAQGFILSNKFTIATLCKKMKKTSVNGLVLFVQKIQPNNVKENDEEQDQYEEQCAIKDYCEADNKQKEEYTININFTIDGMKDCVITVNIAPTRSVKTLVEKFLAQFSKIFIVPKFSKQKITLQIEDKKQLKKLKISDTQINCVSLVNWSNIRVTFEENFFFKKKVEHPENKITIYKQNSDEYIVEIFEEIWFMPFKNIYEQKLTPKYIKGQRQQVCLNVMDILIREDQNLQKIGEYYKRPVGKEYIRIVGRVVSQKMYFYKNMQLLNNQPENQFQIQKHIVSWDTKVKNSNEKASVTDRIRQDLKIRAQYAKLQPFKDIKNIEPIYIYTCEDILYKDESKPGKPNPVYVELNKYLRLENILHKTLEYFKDNWLLRFAHSLFSKLKMLETPQKIPVYRGIDYDPLVKKGDVMTFKSFTSTSVKQIQTYPFMKKNLATKQPFLLEFQINKGSQIKMFSKFQNEQEILLQPFTQYIVTDVINDSFPLTQNNITKYITRIKLVQLDEKESSTVFPETKANFIIWVDDKEKQVKNIYESISHFKDSTILILLNSTKELVQWLSQQKVRKAFNDPTSNIIFVTNMTREGNYYAGIEGVIELQKCPCHMEIPIIFYIGDKKRALQNINQYKNYLKNPQKFLVTPDPIKAAQFLKKTMKINQSFAKESNPYSPKKNQEESYCQLY